MPQAMKSDLQELGQQKALEMIISGFKCTYVKEWEKIYENIVIQIWEIYKNRALEIDKIDMQIVTNNLT